MWEWGYIGTDNEAVTPYEMGMPHLASYQRNLVFDPRECNKSQQREMDTGLRRYDAKIGHAIFELRHHRNYG